MKQIPIVALINSIPEAHAAGAAYGRSVARVAYDAVMAVDALDEDERQGFAAATEDFLIRRPRGCTDEIAAAFTAAARSACGAAIRQYRALLSVGNGSKPESGN